MMITLETAAILVLLVSLPFVASTGTIVCTKNKVVDFNLIDTSGTPPTYTKLTSVVDLSDFSTCKLNIEATIDSKPSNCDEKTVKCVQFFFDGIPVRKEKFAPFTLYGDVTGGAINARQPKLGKHTVKACTYSDKACTKNEMGCHEMNIDFLSCNRTTSPVRSPVMKAPIRPPPPPPPVKVPVKAPIRTAPVNSALSIACNFLKTPNVTACQKITHFFGDVSGKTIPSELGLLTQLTSLDITYSYHLTGTIPSTLGYLMNLINLGLSNNQLTGTIPSTLEQLTKLSNLDLSDNQFTGTIPYKLGQLTQLTYLDLQQNQLSGIIPSVLGQLTQLNHLRLYYNQLTSTIPSTLGQLTQLIYLDLSDNQLNGTIPSTLGQLTQLTYLDLQQNQLTGTIPSTLGQLTQLNWLYLRDNQLRGTVPSTLGNLTQLAILDLYNNTKLTGTIPSALCAVSGIYVGIDCANYVCSCCFSDDGFTSCSV